VTTVAVSVFSSLHGQGTTKITLGEMKGSNLVDAFELVRTQYLSVFVIVSLLSLLLLLVHGCMVFRVVRGVCGCAHSATTLVQGRGLWADIAPLSVGLCVPHATSVVGASVSMKVLDLSD
jgi:uncharacterized membrane protein